MSPPLVQLLDFMGDVPAYVRDKHLNVVASTPMARALSGAFTVNVNLARYVFLNPEFRDLVMDWPDIAGQTTASLRNSLEQHEEDSWFTELVGELSANSEAFATAWAHDYRDAATWGRVSLQHPQVGPIVMIYQELVIPDDFENVLVVWRPSQAARGAYSRLVSVVHAKHLDS